jgi:REP element-mobilizing transposase RayT
MPSEELNTIVRGIIARGVRQHGVEVSYFITMSTHLHVLISARRGRQISRFMNFINSNIAKEAGRLYGWREKFWGRRYRLIPITDEPEAQIARLRYLLAHGCVSYCTSFGG